MQGQIYQLTDLVESIYPRADFEVFKRWITNQQSYQIDIETDITKWWYDKKLISIQFGSCTGERAQWFFQWSALTQEQREWLIWFLNGCRRVKLAHNGDFEYIVLRCYDIILENIYDTMLAEKVLQGGQPGQQYSLAGIAWDYLRLILDKTQQELFGDDVMNDDKILYGCTDVMYLDVIKRLQLEKGAKHNLLNVFGLEMDVMLAFSDITYNGMLLDEAKWRENIHLAEPVVEASTHKINAWLEDPAFSAYARAQGYICGHDRVMINYNSPDQRKELLQLVLNQKYPHIPELVGGGKAIIGKLLGDYGPEFDVEIMIILDEYTQGKYDALQKYLLEYCREYLLTHGTGDTMYLIPAGEVTINWNSPKQVLPLAQIVEPRLDSLDEESINETTHPMLRDLQRYRSDLKLLSTYGEEFIREHVSPDGKVRTNFNQVLTTGRVSSSKPNMQNIIVDERVKTRYRNAFVCEPGWVFVDSDYTSQELVLIAYISKDPVWNDALAKGYDLHSLGAELIFKNKWKEASQSDCAYYRMALDSSGRFVAAKQKCKCEKHKILRDSIKSINFG